MTVSDLHTATALPELVSAGLTYRDADGSVVEYAHLDHGATTPAFEAHAGGRIASIALLRTPATSVGKGNTMVELFWLPITASVLR